MIGSLLLVLENKIRWITGVEKEVYYRDLAPAGAILFSGLFVHLSMHRVMFFRHLMADRIAGQRFLVTFRRTLANDRIDGPSFECSRFKSKVHAQYSVL